MNDAQLAIELRKWFNDNKHKQNKWSRGLGKVIKQLLQQSNNWKNAPRGNPIGGYNKMIQNKGIHNNI